MKKILLVLSLFLVSFSGYAAHVVGGTITYSHVSGKKYDVYITIWRDCSSIQLSQSNLIVSSDTGAVISSQTKISTRDISLADTSAACGNASRCQSTGGILGYQEHLWKCTIDFSNYGTNCSFTLAWEQATRSNAINTGQAGQNFYIHSYINLCYDTAGRELRKFNSPSLAIPYNSDLKYNPDFRDRLNYFDSISYVLSPSLVARTTSAS